MDAAREVSVSISRPGENPARPLAEGVPGAEGEFDRALTGPMQNRSLSGEEERRWYCVRAQTKREHIAAHWLRLQLELETYLPRIRFQRVEARGAVWTTEALFPNYLFARFGSARRVHRWNGYRA